MLDKIITYITALVTFLVLDLFWINIAAREFYSRSLSGYLAPQPNLVPALLLYALLVAGLTYFVLIPARKDKELAPSLMRAAFLGLLCYATYDLTNLAVAREWPLSVTIIDMAWGAVLMTATTAITTILMQRYRAQKK